MIRAGSGEGDAQGLGDREHRVGVALLLGGHRPRAVGLAVDGAEQHRDVEGVVGVELRHELVTGVLLLAAEHDVGRHTERVAGAVLVVVRREDAVLRDAGRRLAEVENGVLVVAGVGLLSGAIVALVHDVHLRRGDVRVALAVGAQVRTVPVGIPPEDRLGLAVVDAEDPEIQVDLVLARGRVPAEAGAVGRPRWQLLGVALLDLQLHVAAPWSHVCSTLLQRRVL